MLNLKKMPDGSYINPDDVIGVHIDGDDNCVIVDMRNNDTYAIYVEDVLDFEQNPDGALGVDTLLERVVRALQG